jgi:hypothetical protein
MSYQPPPLPPPPPDNSATLKSINWGVWILVFVFVILPLLVVACCCAGPPLLGMFGATVEGVTGG